MSKRRKKYSAEFKAKALELARNMGSMKEAAEALGVATPSLYDWKKAAESAGLESLESTMVEKLNKEIKQLRTELKEQQQIIHVLKQAAIFFCQDKNTSRSCYR